MNHKQRRAKQRQAGLPKKMSWHHRKPRSRGGTDESFNLSEVSVIKHRAFHTLFSNESPQEIARILNNDWLDTGWKFIVVRR